MLPFRFLDFSAAVFFVKDTKHHVAREAVSSNMPLLKNIFWETTWKNKNLGSVTQAGLINNLNDGMVWGVLPIFLPSKDFSIKEIAIITAVYPAVWSIAQIFTGKMADQICKKDMLLGGMMVQAVALVLIVVAVSFTQFTLLAILLGWGTAMVYPTFLASIAENTHPTNF